MCGILLRVNKIALLLILIAVASALGAVELYEEVRVGYANDVAVTLGLRTGSLSEQAPVFVAVSGGYVRQLSPGQAEDARAIFINDGTGGNIVEFGQSWRYGLDIGYNLISQGTLSVGGFASIHYNAYTASFSFVGDNEAFRVTTDQLGLGGGASAVIGAASDRVRYSLTASLVFPAIPDRCTRHVLLHSRRTRSGGSK